MTATAEEILERAQEICRDREQLLVIGCDHTEPGSTGWQVLIWPSRQKVDKRDLFKGSVAGFGATAVEALAEALDQLP